MNDTVLDTARTKSTDATTVAVDVTVNGRPHRVEVDPRTSLLDLVRERMQLTGTKKGCDHGQCGACTVHLDGRRVVTRFPCALTANVKHDTTRRPSMWTVHAPH
jgi:xanthine dehydrogenase YagT iron-sulfur-binding subunit